MWKTQVLKIQNQLLRWMLRFWNIFYFADQKRKNKKNSRSESLLLHEWRTCKGVFCFYFYLVRYLGGEIKRSKKLFFPFCRHRLAMYLRPWSNTLNPAKTEVYHYKAESISRVIAPACWSAKHFLRKLLPVYFVLTLLSFIKGPIISWPLNWPSPNRVLQWQVMRVSDKGLLLC